MNVITAWFNALDRVRRTEGYALDCMDLGPRESVYRIIHSMPGARLRRYELGTRRGRNLLIVPAPIKRPYIWDLRPERSVVRRAAERGFNVHLVEWTEPDGWAAARGLQDYIAVILDQCVTAIAESSQANSLVLVGHSLGGTLAAAYGAYRPERIAGLVLIETPLHFAEASGVFRGMLNTGIPAKTVFHHPADRAPGSLLSLIAGTAAPDAFYFERYFDHAMSLGAREDFMTHWQVERWTLDEFAMPQQLFEDVVEQLYREDRFMRAELLIGDKTIGPSDIVAPLFAVYQPSSRIVPSESVLAFYRMVRSRNREAQAYFGDVGVALQHVGALVGDSAHRVLWPRILDWLQAIEK